AIGVRVHRSGRDAELAARSHDADRDLASIGDEYFREEFAFHPTASRGWLGLTTSPSLTYASRTVPAPVVTMSFCIFIASSAATTPPSLTASPALTGILTMRPCIGAMTVP